jgi:hypothetical protein
MRAADHKAVRAAVLAKYPVDIKVINHGRESAIGTPSSATLKISLDETPGVSYRESRNREPRPGTRR